MLWTSFLPCSLCGNVFVKWNSLSLGCASREQAVAITVIYVITAVFPLSFCLQNPSPSLAEPQTPTETTPPPRFCCTPITEHGRAACDVPPQVSSCIEHVLIPDDSRSVKVSFHLSPPPLLFPERTRNHAITERSPFPAESREVCANRPAVTVVFVFHPKTPQHWSATSTLTSALATTKIVPLCPN